MGGHSAWRKRVAQGGLAKEGTGGAIARHRPRMGRRGEDLKLNKKGSIAGGNPKKNKGRGGGSASSTAPATSAAAVTSEYSAPVDMWPKAREIVTKWVLVCISAWFYLQLKKYWGKKQEENPFEE